MNERKRMILKAVEVCFKKGKTHRWQKSWWLAYEADVMAERIRRIWLYFRRWGD